MYTLIFNPETFYILSLFNIQNTFNDNLIIVCDKLSIRNISKVEHNSISV